MLLRCPSRNCAGPAESDCAEAFDPEWIGVVKTSPNLSAQMISLLSLLKIAAVIFLGQHLFKHGLLISGFHVNHALLCMPKTHAV